MLKRRAIGDLSRVVWGFLLACSIVCTPASGAESIAVPEDAPGGAADPVVALVGGEPIRDSEVDRFLAFETPAPTTNHTAAAEPGNADSRDAALDRLIDERLRFREIDRFGFTELPPREIELAVNDLHSRFGSRAAFEAHVEELGLELQDVRDLVAHRRLVSIFVEERLDPRLFVDAQRIRTYYDEVLTPELRKKGEQPPPVDEVYGTIRHRLKAEAFEAEFARWTASLRERVEIQKVP
jgi:hypothetical protein